VVGLVAALNGYNIWPVTIALTALWSFSAALFNRTARDQ
jgi:hypothetical protein